MPCPLCYSLLKELCVRTHSRVLCQVFHDYATNKVDGMLPVEFAVKEAGPKVFLEARQALIDQGILPGKTSKRLPQTG